MRQLLLPAIRLFLALVSMCGFAKAESPPASFESIAFYYGPNPPLADLQAFDIAIVEPDHVLDPRLHARPHRDGAHELFAYVSIGEVQPSRPYYKNLPAGSLRGANEAWGSRVIDQTAAGWSDFFVTRIIAPLWEKGWRGFFIDTLDSYQLFARNDAERARQVEALVATLREVKRRYPEARLILNRGFELMPQVADITFAVAAESLYQGYDARRSRYRPVPAADRDWLLPQLETIRARYRLPVIAIDYVDPAQPGARELARTTAKSIRSHGFIPWVADGSLASIGVSNIELVPRNVLVVVHGGGKDLHISDAQRHLGMPLNHLGLRYEFVDLAREGLPAGVFQGRYAGIVTWLEPGVIHAGLIPWLRQRMREGVRIAMFSSFGFPVDSRWMAELGLRTFGANNPGRLSLQSHDPAFIGYETAPIPEPGHEVAVTLAAGTGRSLLRLGDARGNVYDAAALIPWGGFVLAPFGVVSLAMQDQTRWVVDPVAFLRSALDLQQLPVPDVTTEAGRRILMVHIDGDGFASRVERPGAPFASEVLLKEFLERYRVPTTMSVIEGEVSGQGLFSALTPELESLARRMFMLPHVEAASHSFSHPFYWAGAESSSATKKDGDSGEASYHLKLPGYRFDLTREIKGSIDYINTRLMPPGKTASIFLWTGNCVPTSNALAETYRHTLLNMNGGDTLITESNNSLTAIAAQGIRKAGQYQVYAPNQNENVYTDNWRGPFYGFERVIETFRLTETPVRYKPINIYYHTYAASKPASIKALHKVYGWALAQPVTPLFASQYIRKVLDFENTTLARDLASGELLVRTGADLRTLRLPKGAALPALGASSGIAGKAPGPAADYLILSQAQARLAFQPEARPPVHVREANGTISDVERDTSATGTRFRFTLHAWVPAIFRLGQAASCSVKANGARVLPSRSNGAAEDASPLFELPAISADKPQRIEVSCPQ